MPRRGRSKAVVELSTAESGRFADFATPLQARQINDTNLHARSLGKAASYVTASSLPNESNILV